MVDIKALSPEQKKLLLAMLETELGMVLSNTEKAENEFLVESRKCNEIAKLKKAGKSVIYTELQ
jgi:hypothetical protein